MEHTASVVRCFCQNVDLSPESRFETSQSNINLKQWVQKWGEQLSYLFIWLPKLVAKVPIANYIFSSSEEKASTF